MFRTKVSLYFNFCRDIAIMIFDVEKQILKDKIWISAC
jgi:hypothetical protein